MIAKERRKKVPIGKTLLACRLNMISNMALNRDASQLRCSRPLALRLRSTEMKIAAITEALAIWDSV